MRNHRSRRVSCWLSLRVIRIYAIEFMASTIGLYVHVNHLKHTSILYQSVLSDRRNLLFPAGVRRVVFSVRLCDRQLPSTSYSLNSLSSGSLCTYFTERDLSSIHLTPRRLMSGSRTMEMPKDIVRARRSAVLLKLRPPFVDSRSQA